MFGTRQCASLCPYKSFPDPSLNIQKRIFFVIFFYCLLQDGQQYDFSLPLFRRRQVSGFLYRGEGTQALGRESTKEGAVVGFRMQHGPLSPLVSGRHEPKTFIFTSN